MMLNTFISVGYVYLSIGAVFSVAFVLAGMRRVDAVSQEAGLGFKLLTLPGAALLWPIMLMKWAKS